MSTSTLQYFKIKKNAFSKKEAAANLKANKINSNSLKIIEFGIDTLLLEHVESNLICVYVNESLRFFKLKFFNNQIPEIVSVYIQNENSSSINFKKIAFENKNPDEEIFDITIIKKIRSNCLFISGFEYPRSCEFPNKESINTNFFIYYDYDSMNGIINDVKITFFQDTYYPDDVYNFQTKPIIEALHINYQE